MSLNFGFGYGHEEENPERWTRKFEALNEKDRDFYWNSLPWLMMGVSIQYVSKDTIPEIVKRHKLSPILAGEDNEKLVKDSKKFENYLGRFIGFNTNVNMETDAKFLQKVGRLNNLKLKGNTYRMWKKFQKEVLDGPGNT